MGSSVAEQLAEKQAAFRVVNNIDSIVCGRYEVLEFTFESFTSGRYYYIAIGRPGYKHIMFVWCRVDAGLESLRHTLCDGIAQWEAIDCSSYLSNGSGEWSMK